MKLRRLRRAAALFAIPAALAAGGCTGDGTLPEEAVGNYNLAAVNGQPLPFTYPNTPGQQVVLKEGRLSIERGGDFAQVEVLDVFTDNPNDTDLPNQVSQTAGQVTVNGSSLRFSPRFENSYNGSLTATGLVYTRVTPVANLEFTYVREP